MQVVEKGKDEDHSNLIKTLEDYRDKKEKENQQFEDYVEQLLSHPFLKPEIEKHALSWMHSKIRVEAYEQEERKAARVIGNYAFQLFQKSPQQSEFLLNGKDSEVRVFVYTFNLKEQVA